MSQTLKNFGYPNTLVKEYQHWYLLMRPEQTTLGSMVLICKDKVKRYSDISEDSFREYSLIIREIEFHLAKLFDYDKINYLMLMMKDPDVHYHIVPRYKKPIVKLNHQFMDNDWPSKPSLANANNLEGKLFNQILKMVKKEFTKPFKKFKRVYTTGCFDFLHHGHLNILRRSKEIADFLLVGVSTDELIEKEKGKKPMVPFKERINIVSSIKYVDKVIPQEDKNKQKIVDQYNIDAITVGDDWKGRYPKVSCKMVYFPYTNGISSTSIKSNT